MSRLRRHAILLALTGLALAGAAGLLPHAELIERLSVASAWWCLLLLVLVFLISPLRTLRGQPHAANLYLRRDIAIWAVLSGLLHFLAGTEVSMNPDYLAVFVDAAVAPPDPGLRRRFFFWGSLAGFAVGILFLLLLSLSNDRAIRLLGTKWWRRLQKSAWLAFGLTVAHGIAFQVLEADDWLRPALLGILVAPVLVVRFAARGRGN